MRKRNRPVQVMLSEGEYQQLLSHAKRCSNSISAYLRLLITGYEPKATPPLEYHQLISQLLAIGHNLNQITAKLHATHHLDAEAYAMHYRDLMQCVLTIQEQVERPKRNKN
jgi:hypothetical protein